MPAKMKCPECGESVERGKPKFARSGWTLNVDEERLQYRHEDREPLCPVVTSKGYQPAMPTRA